MAKLPFSRAARLVGTLGRVVGQEFVPSKLKRFKQAKIVTDALGDLKGAAMKAGQWVGMELAEYLPEEALSQIRTLQDEAKAVSFDVMEKMLQKELKEKLRDFEDIDPHPLGVASIGQVHAATLKGQPVVLKIQYPGVTASIRSDLRVVRRLSKVMMSLSLKNQVNIEPLFDELERELVKETDYLREMENLKFFGQALNSDRRFAVPKPYEKYCTKKVLCMEHMDGIRVKDWIQNGADPAMATVFLDLLFLELFELRRMQTDPNYGNFLFQEGTHKIVLLDFGSVKKITKETTRFLLELIRANEERDDQKLLDVAYAMELIDPDESAEVHEIFIHLIRKSLYVFDKEAQPFVFANSDYLEDLRATVRTFAFRVKKTAPARKLVLVNRKLGGIFLLLKEMDARVDLRQYLDRI